MTSAGSKKRKKRRKNEGNKERKRREENGEQGTEGEKGTHIFPPDKPVSSIQRTSRNKKPPLTGMGEAVRCVERQIVSGCLTERKGRRDGGIEGRMARKRGSVCVSGRGVDALDMWPLSSIIVVALPLLLHLLGLVRERQGKKYDVSTFFQPSVPSVFLRIFFFSAST